jgi:hypothetical protein
MRLTPLCILSYYLITNEGQERVRAADRDNYARLAKVKAKYDPQNLSHLNQNIKPAT